MIYDKFFLFREEPFGVTPDPKFLYMSKKHEDALAHLKFGMSENRGFVMLTGEVGSGKTTLIRFMFDNLGADTHTSLIINPMVEPFELLKLINHDFGVSCSSDRQKDHMDALNAFLLECYAKDEKAVLVIDEAQELSIECLEFIRLLSNLETNTKKLMQVFLVGQPELKKIVSSERLRQLDQRIAVRYHLQSLDLVDTIRYINHRLKIAGGAMVEFPDKGIKMIHEYSRGIPRLINLACDRTLLLSYSNGSVNISTNTVKKAVRDLKHPEHAEKPGMVFSGKQWLKPAVAGIFFLILLIILVYNTVSHEENYFEKLSPAKKTAAGFFINDGIYMTSDDSLADAVCTANLLTLWGAKNFTENQDILKEVEKRGFSVYRLGNDLEKAVNFNIPCILYLKDSPSGACAVLQSVAGENAVIVGPREGRKTIPIKILKDQVTDISYVYKNKFTDKNMAKLLQQELKSQGVYKYYITGYFGPITKRALIKYQRHEGIKPSGELDDATAFLLSRNESFPKLAP